MAFDVQGAMSAGANPDDIINYLKTSRGSNFDVSGAVAAGANKTDIINYLANKPAQTAQPTNGATHLTPAPQPTTDNPQYTTGNTSQNNANKVAQVLGVQKFGAGLATAGLMATGQEDTSGDAEGQAAHDLSAIMAKYPVGSPERKAAVEKHLSLYSGGISTQAQIDPGTQLSNKEVLGSAANVGLLAATPGLPTGGSSLVGKVAAGAGLGYASDVAQSANNNQQNILKPGLGTAVGAALPAVASVGGEILKSITGLTTGAGKDVIQRAVENPDAVNAAINKFATTPEAKQQLVDTAKNSINQYLQQRSQQYGQSLSELKIPTSDATSAITYVKGQGPDAQKVFTRLTPEELAVARDEVAKIPTAEGGNQIHLDPLNSKLTEGATELSRPDFIAGHPQAQQVFSALPKQGIPKQAVIDSFSNAVGKFGGQIKDGALTFGDTALNSSEQKSVPDVFNTVKSWQDVTPQGMDTLRQRIGNEMSNFKFANNGRDSTILGNVKSDLTQLMKDKIPGYGDMLSTYGAQTQTAKDLAGELSLKGTAKPATQLNKVMSLFKKDPSVMANLTKTMGPTEANKFLNDVSGAILSNWMPGHAAGTFGSEAGLATAAHLLGASTPEALAGAAGTAAISSPKIVGKGAVLAGKAIQTGADKLLGKAATVGASKIK